MNGWFDKQFQQLTAHELWAVLRLRQQVFVLEQKCLYPDIDDSDRHAQHLAYWVDGEVLAYARLLAPGISYEQASIGRVAVAPAARASKLGRELMLRSIKILETQYPNHAIKIGAQKYLENFYNKLGFATISDAYIEDGIEHIHMLKNAKPT